MDDDDEDTSPDSVGIHGDRYVQPFSSFVQHHQSVREEKRLIIGLDQNALDSHEKDSGIGKTDESTKNDESSEQDCLDNEIQSPPPALCPASYSSSSGSSSSSSFSSSADKQQFLSVTFGATVAGDHPSLGASDDGYSLLLHRRTKDDDERFLINCNAAQHQHHVTSLLSWSSNCDSPAAHAPASGPAGQAPAAAAGHPPTETAGGDAIHHGRQQQQQRPRNKSSLEEEIASLNYEMERIQFQCQQLVDRHRRQQRRSKSDDRFEAEALRSSSFDYHLSPRLVPRMGTRLQDLQTPLPQNSTIGHCNNTHVDDQSMSQSRFKAKRDKATTAPGGCDQWHPIGSLSPCKRFYQALALQKRSSVADPCFPSGSIPNERNFERPTSRPEKPLIAFHRSAHSSANYKTPVELGGTVSQASAEAAAAAKGGGERGASANLMQLVQQRCHLMTHTGLVDCKHHSRESDAAGRKQPLQGQVEKHAMQKVHSSLIYSASAYPKSISSAAQQTAHQQKPLRTFGKGGAGGGGGGMVRGGADCNVGETGIGEVEHFETVDNTSNDVFRGSRIKDCSMSPSKVKSNFPSPPPPPQSKVCRPSASPSPLTGGGGGCLAPAVQSSAGRSSGSVEWVVKRRSDGTRYVMRRPTRSRVLKERARQLAEERCSSTTTDDDAASELKRGRYWNRDARRRHLEMAKDRKSRKEMMQQQQQQARESARLSSQGGRQPRLQLDIVEMSRRQMMQRQDKLFDNFTTLQELLAHGNREPPQPLHPHPPHPSSSTVVDDDLHSRLLRQQQHRYQHINPLLSVTTV